MANNLKALREAREWTQEQAAAAMRTTRNQYAKLEGGSRQLSPKWIDRAAEAYGIDAGEIVTSRRDVIPIVGYVGAGAESHFYAENHPLHEEAPAPTDATEDTVALIIRGDSLGSFFEDWLVIYDDVKRPVTRDLVGKLCVVGLPNGQVLVKKIKAGKSRGLFHLFGQFGDPILDTPIDWAAKVKDMRPR